MLKQFLRTSTILASRNIHLSAPKFVVKESDLITAIQGQLPDARVNVTDISDGCGSNFQIEVISNAFDGKRPVNRTRMVNKAIKPYMSEIHMIRVTTFTDDESRDDE